MMGEDVAGGLRSGGLGVSVSGEEICGGQEGG